jgi:hypothetical protein
MNIQKLKKFGITKVLLLVVLGVGVLGSGAASAVSLGIQANNGLGAGTSVTAACQPSGVANDISVTWAAPTYVPATNNFTVSSLNLANIAAACNGKSYKVVVADASGASLYATSGTITGTSTAITVAPTVAASAVASVAVTIYG